MEDMAHRCPVIPCGIYPVVLLVYCILEMSTLDWIILSATLLCIIVYGIYKGRGQTGSDSFILAGKNQPWYTVLIGIMATQASAITFISGPGQSYSDGMRFIQYYFGLPLAMIVISAVFIPYFQKQKVYTAYQFLDTRFDRKTRIFTGILFLFSRGISTGMSVLAPAIVLSAIFHWNIEICSILIGGFLIIYSITGGAKAIAHTQKLQFAIIIGAMILAGVWVVRLMPEGVGLGEALLLAGKSGKLNVITTDFNLNDKFNIWSGVIGGFFLALSYFGTDQSQVGRYLTGKDLRSARMGILMNGIIKIPMQFFILLLGALLFSFFLLQKSPVFFNQYAWEQAQKARPDQMQLVGEEYQSTVNNNEAIAQRLLQADRNGTEAEVHHLQLQLQQGIHQSDSLRGTVTQVIRDHHLPVEEKDVNYVFLYFVQHYLPAGVVGLIFAIIFLASWGSISAALNSLASATLIDFHQLMRKKKMNNRQELAYARWYTLFWGIFSILTAIFIAKSMGSLIEAVNVLGSLFYGPILGIFLVAFFFKSIKGSATFWAVVVSEIIVIAFYWWDVVAFLWLNVVGALAVILLGALFQSFRRSRSADT